MGNALHAYGSVLRPDLYGKFKEADWRGRWNSRDEYIETVIEWELAVGVKPKTSEDNNANT